MLAARRIPQILQDHLTDGIEGVCLMTKEGSLLSSSFAPTATIDEIGLAAISSSIWGNYSEGSLDEIRSVFIHTRVTNILNVNFRSG
jgi:predicted regulator of Ras-like GTPase activity (Roadblock/LC7/MglB family)